MPTHLARLGIALALIFLAIAPRFPLLMAPAPGLHRSGSGPGNASTAVGEELHRGTTAQHWITGTLLSVPDYQFVAFHGGPFVTSALAVPLFLVFGPSLVALKATGLVFHLVALLFVFLILQRLGGRRAAWFGTILYAGTPPGYAILNLVAYGTHVEANTLALGALYCYLRWLERPSRGRALAFGIVAGFGVFFTYTVALTVAAIGLHALWTRRLGRTSAGLMVVGGIVGFAPWLYLNLRNGLAGAFLYGGLAGPPQSRAEGPQGFVERIQYLATQGFSGSGYFADLGPISASVLDMGYAVLLLAGLVGLFVGRRTESRFDARYLVAIPVLFMIAFSSTHFEVGWPLWGGAVTFRYVYVLYPCLILGLALLAARVAAGGAWARWATSAAVALVALVGAFGSSAYVDPARWGDDLDHPGYDNRAFGRFVALTLAERPEDMARCLDRAMRVLPRPELHRFRVGLVSTLYQVANFDETSQVRPEYARRAQAARATLAYLDAANPHWADAVPDTWKQGWQDEVR